ncbi:MAG: VCBS repeat-containing protein, partial [Euryarchaeota archaeon]|nr:VCBS repeat-containing protein [Euryarchaeota archaeon]
MVSRVLMLSGGSVDAKLANLNGDNLTDLMVAVYEAKKISIFFRQSDGTFPTYPSFNLTTVNNPFAVAPIDVFASGGHQIVSLERNVLTSGTRLIIYNLTSETTYDTWPDTGTYSNAVGLVVGNFSMDNYPDIAVACAGPNPSSTQGRIDVFFGPDFASWGLSEVLLAGLGTNSIAAGDLDNDALEELAVGNYHASSVMVYHQPFDMVHYLPHQVLNITGNVTGLATGKLHLFNWQDLAVATENPSALHLYFQDASPYLPSDENLNLSLSVVPSYVNTGDINGDGKDDLLVLSARDNVTFGFYQGSINPIWVDSPDFEFPTGAIPRSALVGDLNGDSEPDISITSAGRDWSGGTIAIYPARAPRFSNANATSWTNKSACASMIATGDLNGDDVIDLVSLNPATSSFDYILSFLDPVGTVSLGYVPGEVIVADFDGDGCSDVLTSMSSGTNLTITFGNRTFHGNTVQLTCGGNVIDIVIGDFNGDGLIDILAATDEGKLDIFFNSGQPQPFSTPYEYVATPGSGIWSVVVGDFNSDGLDDIAFTRSIRKITILLQNPSVPFGPQSPSLNLSYSSGADFTRIWSGDVTGDGKTDIVAMRNSDPTLYLFNQTMFPAQTPYAKLILPEEPKFVSVLDATDRGRADVVAIFDSEDLLFLYRQEGGTLPSTPSMTFVTGAGPNYAVIGDGTRDHRGDLLVNEIGSHTVSMWSMINVPPVVHAGGPYAAREGDVLQLNDTVATGTSEIPFMNYTWDF